MIYEVEIAAECGKTMKIPAEFDRGEVSIPYGTSREEVGEILDGLEIHLYSTKRGRRLKALEDSLTEAQWKDIRQQIREWSYD